MSNAANTAFANGYKAVFQIGTDCPDLNSEYLAQALENMVMFDIVLGPATDGGYVLLAQKARHDQLYKDIFLINLDLVENSLYRQNKLH